MDTNDRQEPGTGIAARRRTQIIGATMRLIAHDGVAALSTRKIARQAGVNLATLHYAFGSKDDLLLAVLDDVTCAMIAALAAHASAGDGLCASLSGSIATLVSLVEQESRLPRVRCALLLHLSRDPARLGTVRAQHHRYVEALRNLYRQAVAPGKSVDILCDDLVDLVSTSIDGLALQSALRTADDDLAPARERLLRRACALAQARWPAEVQAADPPSHHRGPPGTAVVIERVVKGMDTECNRATHVEDHVAPRARRGRGRES